MDIDTAAIDRKKYPELDLLLWDTFARTVTGELAFATYERKWLYVDIEKMGDTEKTLIVKLTERYGNGHYVNCRIS